MARHGVARLGKARLGRAWRGKARLGLAWHGMEGERRPEYETAAKADGGGFR